MRGLYASYEDASSRFCRRLRSTGLPRSSWAVLIFGVHLEPPIGVRNARAASSVGRSLIIRSREQTAAALFKRMRDTLISDSPFDPARRDWPV